MKGFLFSCGEGERCVECIQGTVSPLPKDKEFGSYVINYKEIESIKGSIVLINDI